METESGSRGKGRAFAALATTLAVALLATAPAQAEHVRRFQETFGSAAQPTFSSPAALAVYQSGPHVGDLLVANAKQADEKQQVTFTGFASGDTFKLTFEGETTATIAYSTSAATFRNNIKAALAALPMIAGASNIAVAGSPPTATVEFRGTLGNEPLPLMACATETGGGTCLASELTAGLSPTISRFKPNGEPDPFSTLASNVITLSGTAEIDDASRSQLAIDESSGTSTAGDIYLTEFSQGVVQAFGPGGERLEPPLREFATTPFGGPRGVAVDAAGALYVGDYTNGAVHRFLPSANPPKSTDFAANCAEPGGNVENIGAAAGAVYALASKENGASEVVELGNSCGEKTLTFAPVNRTATRFLSADLQSGNAFVSNGSTVVEEYDPSGELASVTQLPGEPHGLVGTPNRLYVSQGSQVQVYGPTVTVPTSETKAASQTTPSRATLNGTVDPDGAPVSECHFEYLPEVVWRLEGNSFTSAAHVPCGEYEEGGTWHTLSSPSELGEGKAAIPVRTAVGGLLGGLTKRGAYKFRLIAASECETGVQCAGQTGELTLSLPTVGETRATSEEGGATATLNGAVDPDATAVGECRFEYLREADYQAAGPVDEIQTIILQGASEGSFALRFEGDETPALPYNASAKTVEATLATLPSIVRAGEAFPNVEVSGSPGGPYTVTFEVALANRDVEQIEAESSPSEPLGPSGATVSVATTRAGVSGFEASIHVACGEYESPLGSGEWHTLSSLAELGEGEGQVPVRAKLTGIVSSTAYRDRLLASNGNLSGSASVTGIKFSTKNTVTSAPATEVTGHAATLNGSVNPLGETVAECFFEYGPEAPYGQSAPCSEYEAGGEWHELTSPSELSGNAAIPVRARVTGLDSAAAYHFRAAAKIGAETSFGADLAFTTLGPLIEAQWSEAVTATEATLRAKINPKGALTSYHLLWGPASDPAAHERGPLAVGEGESPHTVSVFLSGLSPADSYRYRFIAVADCNEAEPAEECEVEGEELSFDTYATSAPDTSCPNQSLRTGPAASLPDCRAYEMVSPLDKNGGGVAMADSFNSRGMPGQAATDGGGLAFGSVSSFAGPRASSRTNQYIAKRGAGGWSTQAIAPRLETPGVLHDSTGLRNELSAYSPDLSSAWLANENEEPLTAAAQQDQNNLYRRDNANGAYEALTVAAPREPCSLHNIFGHGLAGEFVGTAADLSQQFFQTEAPLTADAALGSCASQIYDLAGGSLRLVSVLPDGAASAADARAGSPFGISNEGYGSMRGAVSSGGSRLFWTAGEKGELGTVYVRLNPDRPESAGKDGEGDCEPEAERACTVQLSEGATTLFLDAATDGSEALLVTKGGVLEEVAAEGGARTRVAGAVPLSQEPSFFDTGFLGAAGDLSRIYFTSREALAPGAAEGANNLYLYHEGEYTLIGELSAADLLGGVSPTGLSANAHTARVSPGGEELAFTSNSAALARQAAGYDNADLGEGKAAREVYLYNAGNETLHCVSCNPSGARPAAGTPPPEPFFAAATPAAATLPIEPSVYHSSRALSDDGTRVFFEAYDALLPTDTNGTWDVYEWEAPGAGSCHTGDWNYFSRDGGCISLISTGTDPQPSEFFDADPEGENVFIRTAQSIARGDEGAYDVYDARVEGGFEAPEEAAACEGEACQSPPGASPFSTPASAAFSGAGNLSEGAAPGKCPKGRREVKKKGKSRCVARKHKKHKRKQGQKHKHKEAKRR